MMRVEEEHNNIKCQKNNLLPMKACWGGENQAPQNYSNDCVVITALCEGVSPLSRFGVAPPPEL